MRALFDLLDRTGDQLVDLPLWDPAAHDAVAGVGPGWLVVSSTALDSLTPSAALARAWANESTALARGATVVRAGLRYGPGRTDGLSRLLAARRAGRGRRVALRSPDLRCQPIHELDLAGALNHISRVAEPGARIDVVGPETVRIGELVRRVIDLDGGAGTIRRRVGLSGNWPDTETLSPGTEIPGWSPVPLNRRLAEELHGLRSVRP